MSDVRTSGEAAAGHAEQLPGAVFHCASCGHEMNLPEGLLGRQAKCPKCGAPGVVERPTVEVRELDERDVQLDDLVADAPLADAPRSDANLASGVDPESQEFTVASSTGGRSLAQYARDFFAGSLLRNIFSGVMGGIYLCIVCLAFALLFFSLPLGRGAFPHALWIMLVPAVLGTMVFALQGRFNVALGAPEPAACFAVLMLMAAIGGEKRRDDRRVPTEARQHFEHGHVGQFG